jgi:hypothetical protein
VRIRRFSFDSSGRPGARQSRFAVAFAVLVGALIVPATATAAAKWLDYPTCTATSTTLTCNGKAAGIARQFTYPDAATLGIGSQVGAYVAMYVRYICAEPDPLYGDPGFSFLSPASDFNNYWGGVLIKNGETFTISISPSDNPPGGDFTDHFLCLSGWTRDPNYYAVSVNIGWSLDLTNTPYVPLPPSAFVLSGPVGTVIAS